VTIDDVVGLVFTVFVTGYLLVALILPGRIG
jgi:hypothetical protein